MNPIEEGADAVDADLREPRGLAMQRLQPRVVWHWLITGLARAMAMSAATLYLLQEWGQAAELPPWSQDAAFAFVALLLSTALVSPPWSYATWHYAADDRLLWMRHGMLFVEDRRVPVPRMQHVDITRGPVERLFGLATLVVFTAGNEGSAFRVPGLSIARAEALRDGILRARGRDVV